MRRLQVQFVISYATFGCLGPLLPVFLKEARGFDEQLIGINQALTSLATVLTPALVGFLADKRIDSRRILFLAFSISALAFFLIWRTSGVVPTLALYMLHSLVFIPAISLQDGYFFAANQQRLREGRSAKVYNQVRAWGSLGFVLPSLGLFFLLRAGVPITIILPAAMSFAIMSCLHSFRLPRLDYPAPRDREKGLPTLQALKVLAGPKGRYFCCGLILALSASFPYHGFFPLYLKEIVHLPDAVIGPVFNLGVFLEIFYILAINRFLRVVGPRKLMLLGLACMTLRYVLLVNFPSVTTALCVQLLHGPEIAAIFVLPIMFLNHLASDEFRNSIQGVYTMFIVGGSRIISALVAGKIAKVSLFSLYTYGACLAALSFSVLLLFFRPDWSVPKNRQITKPEN